MSSSTTPAARTDNCTPTTSLLRFDGGYEVSMCYATPDGVDGQAKGGLYASAESGLLWFFSRDNAEVLVKVLNGCAINGYRWIFVAPVTTLEFDLRVTSPTGVRWSHGNTQGETAATKSDVAAFACADEPEATPDLIVSGVTVSDAAPVAGETITLRATVRNRGDGPADSATLYFLRSGDPTIHWWDHRLGSHVLPEMPPYGHGIQYARHYGSLDWRHLSPGRLHRVRSRRQPAQQLLHWCAGGRGVADPRSGTVARSCWSAAVRGVVDPGRGRRRDPCPIRS